MAKKAARKAREAEERKVSGVPVKTPAAPAGAEAAGPSPKDVKRQLRAARPPKGEGDKATA